MQRRAVVIFARGPRAESLAKRLPERVFRDLLGAWRRVARSCGATAIVADVQRGATFGERLASAAADAFDAGFDTLLVTGIDTPPVPSLDDAFASVESGASDAAIAPSTDGGVNAIVLRRNHVALLTSFVQRDRGLAARCIEYFGGRVFLLATSTDLDSPLALRAARCEPLWSAYFRTESFFSPLHSVPLYLCGFNLTPRAPPVRSTPQRHRDTEEDGACPAITCLRISRGSARSRRPIPSCSIYF